MAQNYTKETFQKDSTWTCPAGVSKVQVSGHKIYSQKLGSNYNNAYLHEDGTLYMQGANASGNMGDGSSISKSSATAVIGGLKFKQVCAAESTTLAMSTDGNLYAWGYNSSGIIGDNTTVSKSSPVAVAVGSLRMRTIDMNIGYSACVISSDLFPSGWGALGFVGDNTAIAKSTPVAVAGGLRFTRVYGGTETKFAFDERKRLYAWGRNTYFGLGLGFSGGLVSSPALVASNLDFISISSDTEFDATLGITSAGELYGWGTHGTSNLQLFGLPSATRQSPALLLSDINGSKIKRASSGSGGSTAVITENGDLYTWGFNSRGELGDGTTTHKSTPTLVLGSTKFQEVFCKYRGVLAIDVDGNYWAWGSNSQGEIDATLENKSSPVLVAPGIKYKPYKELRFKTTIDVVPGTVYPITSGFWYGQFGSTLLGTDIQEITLEYFG